MPSVILGIDIGTTSVSAVAIDEAGQPVATATAAHRADVVNLPDGCHEQHPDRLWNGVKTVVGQVMSTTPQFDVSAIGFTGQMHSTLLLDDKGIPCSNVITWKDKRAVTLGDDGRSLFERLMTGVDSSQMLSTGCQLAPGYLGTTIFALQRRGEFPRSAARATFVADWIAARFCQQHPVTDRSHAASSGIYDLQRNGWHEVLMQATEVDRSLLPEVSDSGVVIGTVAVDVANEIGIAAGTPVCNAIGDNQAAVLSSLPPRDDVLLVNIGTGGQIVWRVSEFQNVANMDTRYLPSPGSASSDNEQEFMLVGAGLCGGDAIAWITDTIQNWMQAFGISLTKHQIRESLADQMSQLSPDVVPINCEPFFAGTRPEPQRRGVFRGVGANNFTPANVASSILGGIAETMHGVFESVADHRPNPLRRIVLAGNGARKNPQLTSAIAERFGVPATVSPFEEEAAIGAAMLAGVRIGVWPNLSALHRETR